MLGGVELDGADAGGVGGLDAPDMVVLAVVVPVECDHVSWAGGAGFHEPAAAACGVDAGGDVGAIEVGDADLA